MDTWEEKFLRFEKEETLREYDQFFSIDQNTRDTSSLQTIFSTIRKIPTVVRRQLTDKQILLRAVALLPEEHLADIPTELRAQVPILSTLHKHCYVCGQYNPQCRQCRQRLTAWNNGRTAKLTCYHCQKTGHLAPNCGTPRQEVNPTEPLWLDLDRENRQVLLV